MVVPDAPAATRECFYLPARTLHKKGRHPGTPAKEALLKALATLIDYQPKAMPAPTDFSEPLIEPPTDTLRFGRIWCE